MVENVLRSNRIFSISITCFCLSTSYRYIIVYDIETWALPAPDALHYVCISVWLYMNACKGVFNEGEIGLPTFACVSRSGQLDYEKKSEGFLWVFFFFDIARIKLIGFLLLRLQLKRTQLTTLSCKNIVKFRENWWELPRKKTKTRKTSWISLLLYQQSLSQVKRSCKRILSGLLVFGEVWGPSYFGVRTLSCLCMRGQSAKFRAPSLFV